MRNIFEQEPFIMFDKKFIKSKESKNKLPLVMAYLKINGAMNGNVSFSINYLVEQIGYVPDSHDGRINSKVINALDWLEKNNYIFIMAALHGKGKVNNNKCFLVQINKDHDIFVPKGTYVTLTESEFNTITKTQTKCDKQDLLNVFLNIKKYINFGEVSNNMCYPSHATLCRDCKISSTGAMNNIISELISIGVLYTYNSGQYKDSNDNVKYANSFYAIEDNILQPEICDSIIKDYYLSQGLVVEKFFKEK